MNLVTERQLEYVVAIAETGSFTAAADRCHIAQSALSHQIARLEARLHTRLFDRTSRSVHLTDAGSIFLPTATRILADMAAAREELDALHGVVRGQLRIGATQTACRTVDLLPLLGEYNRQHRAVDIAVTMGPGFELVPDVATNTLDIAFAALDGLTPPSGVTFVPLGAAEPIVAVVALDHPLAAAGSVRLAELAATSRFVDFRARTTLWNKVEALCAAAGVTRDVMCELGHLSEMVRLAATGLAVAIVPRTFTEPIDGPCSSRDDIRVLTLDEPGSSLQMGLFLHADRSRRSAIHAFVELLTERRNLSM